MEENSNNLTQTVAQTGSGHHAEAIADVVRGFFRGFMTGRLDKRSPQWRQERDAKLVRSIIMEDYQHVAGVFCQTAFPIILAMRFDSFAAAEEDLSRHHFNEHTSVKLMMRYACGSRDLYEVMIRTYKDEMTALLSGTFCENLDGHSEYFRRAFMDSHGIGFYGYTP